MYLKTTVVKCASCGRANIFNQPYPYHAGFSDQGFLYNDAGDLTLTWSCYDPAYGGLTGGRSPWMLSLAEQQAVEAALRAAPHGGRWRFSNPARCLSCRTPISGPIGASIYYLLYDGSIHASDLETGDLLFSQQLAQNA